MSLSRPMQSAPGQSAPPRGRLLGPMLLAALLLVLLAHTAGAAMDFMAAARNPLQLDYGEGIVWQQTLLIPGPDMYRDWTGLPFIVFHYPPIYYLLVRAAMLLHYDVLATGRVVAMVCGVLAAGFVAGTVLVTAGRPGERTGALALGIAVAVALMALNLHAFRAWTILMRVDMPAIVLSLAGLCLGLWADGRFRGTAAALLLCAAAVFAKQTQLSAGAAVFLYALMRNPRGAVGAAAVAGGASLAVVGALQALTDGGFLHHVIGNNLNQMSAKYLYWALYAERSSIPFMALAAAGFFVAAGLALPSLWRMRPRAALNEAWALRHADRPIARRATVLLYFMLSGTVMVLTLLKSGGSFNYMIEWFCTGAALIGVVLIDLGRIPATRPWFHGALLAALAVSLAFSMRVLADHPDPAKLIVADALVARIRAADKPVASEDMTLLMRAGKSVTFEPAIVTDLALVGRWDEAPLVAMMRQRGFAFVITVDNGDASNWRTPGVAAAMREGYPVVQQLGPFVWLRLPPAG